jgi:hypothetical protein
LKGAGWSNTPPSKPKQLEDLVKDLEKSEAEVKNEKDTAEKRKIEIKIKKYEGQIKQLHYDSLKIGKEFYYKPWKRK